MGPAFYFEFSKPHCKTQQFEFRYSCTLLPQRTFGLSEVHPASIRDDISRNVNRDRAVHIAFAILDHHHGSIFQVTDSLCFLATFHPHVNVNRFAGKKVGFHGIV